MKIEGYVDMCSYDRVFGFELRWRDGLVWRGRFRAVTAIMKLQKLLIFSVLLNLCLLALAVYSFLAGRSPVAGSPGASRRVAAGRAEPAVGAPQTQSDWAAIRSRDWNQYVKNLRGTGCPEETVQDIIFAEVNKAYAAR